jgi:phage terminase Nu1 subunit (DNA packaging protein)
MTDQYVRRDRLAKILMVGPTHINYLCREGMPKADRGKYDLEVCVQWYINNLRDKIEGKDIEGIEVERKKLVTAQRKKIDLESAKMRGEMIPVEVVARTLNEIGVIISTQLDGIAARHAGMLATMHEPAEIQKVLFDESRSIRGAVARSIKDYATMSDNGGDHKPAPTKKRRTVGKRKKDTSTRKPRARTVQK